MLEQINPNTKELPYWLNFNTANLEFGGIAPDFPQPDTKILITGFNPMTSMKAKASITIIVLKNNNPKVKIDLWPRDVYIYYDDTIQGKFGSWWQWTVNPKLFWDPFNDNWSPRTFCEGSHSHPLPDWLSYNERNRTIYGWANKDAEGVHSVDCTFFDDQGESIYANFRIIVAPAKQDWLKWIAVLAVTSAGVLATMVFLFYFYDYHTRAINKPRLRRLKQKQRIVANIEERFNDYRDIELQFYLPDPEDAFILEHH